MKGTIRNLADAIAFCARHDIRHEDFHLNHEAFCKVDGSIEIVNLDAEASDRTAMISYAAHGSSPAAERPATYPAAIELTAKGPRLLRGPIPSEEA